MPIGRGVEIALDFIIRTFMPFFDAITMAFNGTISALESALLFLPPLALIIIIAIVVWLVGTKWLSLGTFVGLLLILDLGLWEELVETMALVFIAVIIALLLGIPWGIWMTRSNIVNKITSPLLDFMQTMPPFVYLIPAVMLFGIGKVPGLVATLIFSIPPPVRLTYLGITQVSEDLKEAARAFGASERQVLTKVELPLSIPSLLAGVNQCIMLAISMVVISSMIGAGGLGELVLMGVNRLDIATGFEGGLAIVILAMVFDRASRSLGNYREIRKKFKRKEKEAKN
ncbi:glycine/betaine ABC transporter permease [Petrotoga mexicana DSM 14811]|uniref:Glycine/betaine ABC transporter permease n=1 Tax=Petrotoga mexicana DSM 14811 TaxID=1122954 RepID=A0A2K1P680_9BACT|nr:glycine/betaine ABC transporter permease [Petrotoga mexicana DSM 14811]